MDKKMAKNQTDLSLNKNLNNNNSQHSPTKT